MPKNYLLVYSEQLATDIENRLDDELSVESVLEDNKQVLPLPKSIKSTIC